MKQQWTTIQALRGIGMLAVLAAHIMYVERNVSPGKTLLPDINNICQAAIDLFFVISGLVMVSCVRRAQTSEKSWSLVRFLYQRAARIYPLYWISTAGVIGVALLQPGWLVSGMWRSYQGHALPAFLLLPQEAGTVLLVAWTLVYEIYFYVVLAAIGLAPERRMVPLLLAWAMVVVVSKLALVTLANPYLLLIGKPITLDFILGCLAGVALDRGMRSHSQSARRVGLALLLVGFVVFSGGWLKAHGWPRVMLYGVPCAMLVYGMAADEARLARRIPRWLQGLGNASYSIYLTHVPVITLVAQLWIGRSARGYLDNAMMVSEMSLAALVFGSLTYRLLEVPLMKLTRWQRRRPASPLERPHLAGALASS